MIVRSADGRRRCTRCNRYVKRGAKAHTCSGEKLNRIPGHPGAKAATWADVPVRCPRCAGPWRWVTGGVACVLCGREVYVEMALAGR